MTPSLRYVCRVIILSVCIVFLCGGNAYATKLEIDPAAPGWMHLAADTVLYLHIGGGSIGLIMGVVAVVSRKGERVHRAAGNLFFVSMFIAYLIGASVAPFLADGQRPNFVAGVLALYLLITAWLTVKHPQMLATGGRYIGMAVALAIAGMGVVFMHMGANNPSGTVDGSPPEAFIVFIVAGSAAAAGEFNVVLRREITGAARIARHLWRMCFSWFLASGSLFLGQPQVFPDWFNASPLPIALALSPLAAMLFWLVRVRLGGFNGRHVIQRD